MVVMVVVGRMAGVRRFIRAAWLGFLMRAVFVGKSC